jgi:hypothetical protein
MSDLITSQKDNEKDGIHLLEVPDETIETFGHGQYDEEPFVGVRRLLRRNPSLEFCREVIQMNKQELDPAEVKEVGSRSKIAAHWERNYTNLSRSRGRSTG